jgi:hypothetical protein
MIVRKLLGNSTVVKLPKLASELVTMLRDIVISDLEHLLTPLEAASASLRDGVMGLHVSGRTKWSAYHCISHQGSTFSRAAVASRTRVQG